MLCVNLVLFALTAVFVSSVYSKALPSYIKPCKRNDPNLNKCVRDVLINLRPHLLKGIPEFKVPPYDPMYLPKVVIEQGNSQAVSFKATFKDMKTTGASKMEVRDVNIKLEPTPQIDIDVRIPHLRMISNYEINGKFLVVPVQGKGKSDGNFTDVTAHIRMTGRFITKNGQKYMQLTSHKINLRVKKANFYFANLFNGNKQLGDTTNRFINENFNEILREVQPVIEETASGIIVTFFKNVYDKYSYDELFPTK